MPESDNLVFDKAAVFKHAQENAAGEPLRSANHNISSGVEGNLRSNFLLSSN
jgi:hypothetical protein